ncbi:3-hydroxyacyl-CoA dehydrogenase family protein [Ferviditalea candida]|uniref:3-hydroxyacyl-CoA dehydrogenase family protein n=1 Tax=Ferviditalea candida TaxID=3108399 RepID=A0ABU5ZHZ2_9BACL|nr:3-hydroxyacyl-CoA dehydrogenase family protein [Paenibacillaceae bacterium T2]
MEIRQAGIVGSGKLAAMVYRKIQDSGIRAVWIEASAPDASELSILRDCQFVLEAVSDQRPDKIRVLQLLEEALPSQTLLTASVSPSLSVTELASPLRNPERLVGLHFVLQSNRDNLVEVVQSLQCCDTAYLQVYEFMKAVGQVPIRCKDVPGLLVNRLFVPYMNHAIQAYDDGLASGEDLDTAVELGLGYPMGPLKLADTVGLNEYLDTASSLYQELHETKYAPPPLVKKMVNAGFHGKKTGRGFYDYSSSNEDKGKSV